VRLLDAYSVVVTKRLRQCRDFYVGWFAFEVVFEASWFVLLSSAGEPSRSLAFMDPDHPSSPPDPAPYRGDGAFLTLQVADAAAEHDRLTAAGLEPALPLTEEPWGQRRFGVVDPAGMWVDVVEQVEPAPGWWDPYAAG
jgi:catechol 2,3-dioxygenase-like lactoylglutathione lyase family enzyme